MPLHFWKSSRPCPRFARRSKITPLSFEQIEIDKVIASQRTVHISHVESLVTQLPAISENLLDFCLHPGRDDAGIEAGRTQGNAYTFSSMNPGLRLLGAYHEPLNPTGPLTQNHPGGQPLHVVTLLVGYGISTINVFKFGRRIILNNGFHRLYALRSMGIRFAPAVVQHVSHPEQEMPTQIADLPRDYLVGAERPGLLGDFLNEQLNCEVRQRTFLKSLQITWGATPSLVPR